MKRLARTYPRVLVATSTCTCCPRTTTYRAHSALPLEQLDREIQKLYEEATLAAQNLSANSDSTLGHTLRSNSSD
jgi:hypothetical protein